MYNIRCIYTYTIIYCLYLGQRIKSVLDARKHTHALTISSVWSVQSKSPSHRQFNVMHVLSLTHANSDCEQVMFGQLSSSVPSWQSSSRSHTQIFWMHLPLPHVNSSSLHVSSAQRHEANGGRQWGRGFDGVGVGVRRGWGCAAAKACERLQENRHHGVDIARFTVYSRSPCVYRGVPARAGIDVFYGANVSWRKRSATPDVQTSLPTTFNRTAYIKSDTSV